MSMYVASYGPEVAEAIVRFKELMENTPPGDRETARQVFADVLGLVPKEEFPGLTPQEHERLALLAEECGEVLQIVGKILRHGYESYNPFDPEKKTNRQLLETELGDLRLVVTMMTSGDDIEEGALANRAVLKSRKINQYLHHQQIKLEE